jgi:uncharacterized protein YjaG (DUF416 family)
MLYFAQTKKNMVGCSDRDLIGFMGLSIELLAPIYQSFSTRANWGDPQIFGRIVTALYSSALGQKLQQADLANLKNDLDKLSPDLDEFEDGLTSYALDVCIAAEEAVNFLLTASRSHFIGFLTSVSDLLDRYVQEKDDLDPNHPELELIIMRDPFLQREIQRQTDLLVRLKQISLKSPEDIATLRTDFQHNIIDLNLLPY